MFVRRLGLGGALVVAMLATGCGGAGDSGQSQGPGSPGAGAGTPVACTEIGCDSGLFLDLRPIAARMPDVKQVRVCLDDRCQSFSPKEPLAMIVDRKLKSEQSVTVTLTAIPGPSGRAVSGFAKAGPFARFAPSRTARIASPSASRCR